MGSKIESGYHPNDSLLAWGRSSRQNLKFELLKFLYRHTIVTSEALGTCERLTQGRYSAMRRPGVEPATCWLQVQRPNHYTRTSLGALVAVW